MLRPPKVIKRDQLPPKPVFDAEMCLVEAKNANRLMSYHLLRCDNANVAAELYEIFSRLADESEKKLLALTR